MTSISSSIARHDFVVELVGQATGHSVTEWDSLTDGEVLANVESWALIGMRVILVTRKHDGAVYYRDEVAA